MIYCVRQIFRPNARALGLQLLQVKGQAVAIINVQGRVFMKEHLDCPFKTVESILTYLRDKTKTIFVDFHAETTAEKALLGLLS